MDSSRKIFAVTSDLKTMSYGEIELRPLAENEVLVKVEAVPVNPVDSIVAIGLYPHRIQTGNFFNKFLIA